LILSYASEPALGGVGGFYLKNKRIRDVGINANINSKASNVVNSFIILVLPT